MALCPSSGPELASMLSVNPTYSWLGCVMGNLLDTVWLIFASASIIMFIWAGFLFFTAQGDPQHLSQARKAALWAVVGIIVAIVGFSVVPLIRNALGL